MSERIDSAERLISASPQRLFAALTEPAAVARWLPPQDMAATIHEWDFRTGGAYRMTLRYTGDSPPAGKAGDGSDEVEGHFASVDPPREMVQLASFPSADPGAAGEMKMRWTFTPAGTGTRVRVEASDVPTAIDHEVHERAIAETLANLAREAER